jgi:hypothetical protein
MKTLADQVRDLENTRAAKAARMHVVTQKSLEDGRSLDAGEAEEFDALELEIKELDEDLRRFNKLLSMEAQKATPAAQSSRSDLASGDHSSGRGPTIIVKSQEPDEAFEGQFFTRKAIARIIAKAEGTTAAQVAEQRWGRSNPTLVDVIKANVGGHGSATGQPGAELAQADARYAGDFVQFLYAQTVYNQLPLREVPANIVIKGMDGAATGYWVGEGKPIPMSVADFNSVELKYKKVGALTTVSNELLRESSPAAEMMIRDALVQAASQRIDTTFASASVGIAGTTPAGILYNIPATTSAGSDIDGVLNDIKELKQRFIDAKNSGGLQWVMNPGLASSIGLLRNALGQKEFTEINETGGMLEGNPVVVGHNVAATSLILLKPSDIWRIGMGGVEVTMSEHATIEQADDPTGAQDTPTAQSNAPVNMFQTDSVAIKVAVSIDFARRRESAVAWINDASYGGSVST